MHCAVAEERGGLTGLVHHIPLTGPVYERAAASGVSSVWWLTHESNEQAMLLHDRIADKSGFVQSRKLP